MSLNPNSLIVTMAAALLEEEEADLTARWLVFVKRTEKTEDKFKPVLRTAFTKQEESVLSAMVGKPIPDTSKALANAFVIPIKGVSDEAKNAAEAYLGDKFNPADWQKQFETFELPFVTSAFKEAGEAAFSELSFGATFNVTNPRATDYLNTKVFQFAEEVNSTTEAALRRALAQGFDKGEDIRALSQRVADVFGIAKGSRTEMIARTEIVGAANNGTFHGYEQSGIVKTKIWISSRDARVRPLHTIDGEERKLKERFSNTLLHPHDPGGAAGNVIRCRCTIAAGEFVEGGAVGEVRDSVIDTWEKQTKEIEKLTIAAEKQDGLMMRALKKSETVDGTDAIALYDKAAGHEALGLEFRGRVSQIKATQLTEIRKQLHFSNEGFIMDVKFDAKRPEKVFAKQVRNEVRQFSRMIDPALLDDSNWGNTVGVKRIKKGERASALKDTINLSVDRRAETTMHEMGHWLENNSPSIKKKAFAFYEDRTVTDKVEKLADLLPRHGYRRGERTKKDKFIDPYMGKQYISQGKQVSTELISLGLEAIYYNPYELATKDAEMFDFIYNLLRGI